MKKLIPAIVMLIVSAVVLSTASYAWFSTTTTASADGMSVTAEAPSSVLIRETDEYGDTEDEFGASITFSLTEAVVLTPASSVNGVDFFVPTKSEDAQGGMAYDAQIVKAENSTNTNYYYDFYVEIKNGGSNAIDLVLSDLQITGPAIKDAVRVAILEMTTDEGTGDVSYVQIGTNTPYAGYNNTANLGYVRYPTAQDTYAASAGPLFDTSAKNGQTTVLSNNTTVIKNLGAEPAADSGDEDTSTVNLVIRVWIEGQSSVCVSKNANAATDVQIALSFAKLGETETNA